MQHAATGPASVRAGLPGTGAAGASRAALRGFTLVMILLVLVGSATLIWRELTDDLDRAGESGQRRVSHLADELGQLLTLAGAVVAGAEAAEFAAPAADGAQAPVGRTGGDAQAQRPDPAARQAVERTRRALLATLPIGLRLQALDATGRPAGGLPPEAGGPSAPPAPWPPPEAGGWTVGSPVGPAGARWLPLMRRASPNERGVAGWVVWLDHAALVRRLAAELQSADDAVELMRLEPDGRTTLLARAPVREAALGQSLRGPLAEALAREPEGVFDADTRLDGVRRRVAYQQLGPGAPPLVLAHGMAHQGVFERWGHSAAVAVALAGLLAAGIAYVGWRLDRLLGTLARQQDDLARSAAQFRALADNLPDPVVRFDAEGRHLYANAAVERATGMPAEAFLGKTNAELGMPAENVTAWLGTLSRAFDTGAPQRLEFSFPGPGGPRQWESTVLREPGPPGAPPTALVISRDITERHQAAEALADSERRLRAAQRIAGLGHWDLDVATLRLTWSDEHYRLFGVAPATFEPSLPAVEAMTHPDDRPLVMGALRRSVEERQRISIVHRVQLPDGRLRHMQVEGEPVFGPDGQALRCIGTVQDITERQEAAEQIRRLADELEQRVQERTAQLALSEARYRTIFDTVPVAIGEEDWSGTVALLRGLRDQGVTDGPAYFRAHPEFVRACMRAARIVRLNQTAQAMMARYLPRPASAGRRGLEAFYPDDETLPLFVDQLLALWRGDRRYADRRLVPIQGGGSMTLMMTAAMPTLDDAEGLVFACLVDIGELDRLNAELDRSIARLRQVNQELETFTYSVSHDLKAPLRGIDGYSRLLLTEHRDRLDDEGRAFLEHIRRATQHMGTLIDDLLAYSRLERRELLLARLPLAPLVQRVLAGFEAECRARGVALTVDVPETLAVRADDQGLTIALRNLVDNALKFSRDRQPPRLAVRAAPGRLGVALSVEDNGVGFDMKYHDRIFAIFQRLHRAEDYPGTGIGLAIVRKAVERMGGQVRARSAAGQGATFTIELPSADRPAAG